MPKSRVSRGAGRRASSPPDATTLAPSVPSGVMGAWELVYRLSGGLRLDRINGRRSRTRGRVRGRRTAADPGGGGIEIPCEVSVPPPPLLLPAEQVPAAKAESHEHSQWTPGSSAPATRKRVVLLPHAPAKPTDT
jgi:hypothetical protein